MPLEEKTKRTNFTGSDNLFISLIRTIILYFVIIVSLRVMGKRQIGELEPTELVVTILISDLAAVPMQDIGIPLFSGIIPIVSLLALELLFSTWTMKSIKARKILCGKPTIIVENGQLKQREMAKTRFTIDELTECLRQECVTDISTVKYAILETSGKMSILLNPANQPATAEMLNQDPPDTGLPIIVINDGRIMSQNMQLCNLDDKWLESQLKSNGARSAKEVFILSVDSADNVYFAKKESYL